MSEIPHKIHVVIGADSINVEGGEKFVREVFEQFAHVVEAKRDAKAGAGAASASGAADAAAGAGGAGPGAVDLSRSFTTRDGVVSLLALPHGDNQLQEAIVALLYGIITINRVPTVLALTLVRGLRVSGLSPARIDRDIKPVLGSIITKSGFGRGTQYGLTNAGLKRGEEIVRALHG